ncbi:serine/threonine protein kinase/uncharacterized caspase-like protein [Curtobacterium herbarum]|uniref:protein kinase domain-containing protein n=1 Tax=Curtobacterium herbarum TaxID=150122 RepID=UPI00209D9DB1|nr:caspase family protein [Curtobacterium herbarum]MCP1501559.1 serine/threonine protein kinase/uncharacterized caspase-like protein [Curtobacterium herbarum]
MGNKSKHAVVVGINDYQNVPALSGCVRDAQSVAAIFEGPGYGYDVLSIYDDEATRSALLENLWSAADWGGEVLVIYFAGHGDIYGGAGYLLSADGTRWDPGLSLNELAQIMTVAATKYVHVIAIIDACHSGAGTTWNDRKPLTADQVNESVATVNSSRILIAACRPEQVAIERISTSDIPDAQGAFTKVLLEGLGGAAADFQGNITAHGLFAAIDSRMDTVRQTPVFKGDSAGSVILGRGFPPSQQTTDDAGELREDLAKGERLLDEYQEIQARELAHVSRRSNSGLDVCARKLSGIVEWFDSSEIRSKALEQVAEWRNYRKTLRNYCSALAQLSVGDRLPVGLIKSEVGSGGFGKVWEVDGALGTAAFKCFHGSELSDETKVRRFRNGYSSMERLNHPRIVSVHALREAPLGFLMDLVPGADLRSAHIDREDAEELVSLAFDIADTVRFAHGAGVIHRDIKPENVILGWNTDRQVFEPFLTDFDLAYLETNRTVTMNVVGGVVNYAAPEQFYQSSANVSRAATVDIYGFAQLLFFILVGSDPTPDQPKLNLDRISNAVKGLFDRNPAELLISLYVESTKYNPADRIKSMTDVVDILSRVKVLSELASRSGLLSQLEVLQQAAYSYAGPNKYATNPEIDEVSFFGRSGILELRMRPVGSPRGEVSTFEIFLGASQHFGVPGVGSGSQARMVLNQRLDKRVKKFKVVRTQGDGGFFSARLKVDNVPLTSDGVAHLLEVVLAAVAGVEQSD